MALHPEFPSSPYDLLRPKHRWFPAAEELRGTAYGYHRAFKNLDAIEPGNLGNPRSVLKPFIETFREYQE
jgi:hypothetical protein